MSLNIKQWRDAKLSALLKMNAVSEMHKMKHIKAFYREIINGNKTLEFICVYAENV